MNIRSDTPICVRALQQEIFRLEGVPKHGRTAPLESGCEALDGLLPGRGFRRGTLVEWLADGRGTGAQTLALAAAAAACRDGRALVVLDRRREFYPPAAIRLAVDLQNLVLVHAAAKPDEDWALDQALRCPAVGAVLAWPQRLDGRTFRRWQLAAEAGGGLGLLIRPLAARHEPSWADVRLMVETLPAETLPAETLPAESSGHGKRRLRVSLLRCHGAANGRGVEVEIDDEASPLHLAARLAHPTARRCAAGA